MRGGSRGKERRASKKRVIGQLASKRSTVGRGAVSASVRTLARRTTVSNGGGEVHRAATRPYAAACRAADSPLIAVWRMCFGNVRSANAVTGRQHAIWNTLGGPCATGLYAVKLTAPAMTGPNTCLDLRARVCNRVPG